MNTEVTVEVFNAVLSHKWATDQVEEICSTLNLSIEHLMIVRDLQSMNPSSGKEYLLSLLLLCNATSTGSICLPLGDEHLSIGVKIVGGSCDSIRAALNQLPHKVCSDSTENKTPLVIDNDRLYFHKHASNAKALEKSIHTLLSQDESTDTGCRLNSKQIQDGVADVLVTTIYPLEPLQVLGIVNAVLTPFSIISGGPGTGKTTIMTGVIRVLLRLGIVTEISDIKLVAPTGRAAKRMSESLRDGITHSISDPSEQDTSLLKLEAQTIHRLLGANPSRRKNHHHRGNVLRAKLIVVDEVSMVDLGLMNQLLQAIPSGCKVILLGDQFQLPSVGVGAVLSDLMPPLGSKALYTKEHADELKKSLPVLSSDKYSPYELGKWETVLSRRPMDSKQRLVVNRVTILDVSKRCQEDISHLSTLIKLGDAEASLSYIKTVIKNNGSALSYINVDASFSPKQWGIHYLGAIENEYLNDNDLSYKSILNSIQLDFNEISNCEEDLRRLFDSVYISRILCASRKGAFGCDVLNESIGRCVREHMGEEGFGHIYHGSLIMITANDKALNLYNGDTGVIVRDVSTTQLRAVFEGEKGFRSFSIHALPENQPAFAMTIHKSQGSEFKRVMLVLPDDINHRLLTREIVYTGLTRAKEEVSIIASEEVLRRGIEGKVVRQTGLSFWS